MPRVRIEPTGVELEYVTHGPRDAAPVLLLMGLSGSHILWPTAFVDGLVEHGHHVIAFDHRDVGRSTVLHDAPVDLETVRAAFAGWPFSPPYRLEDLARDATGLLDHLGVERAHLIGVSMGGMIAQHLAFSNPDRVASLTSINSTTGMVVPPEPLPEPVAVPDPRPPTEWDEFRFWFVDGLRELSSPRWFDEAETTALARAVWERGVHPDGNLRHLLAILADGDRTERLRGVTAPTLVIHGADDPLVEVADGRATAAAVPGARLVVLDDMAHELPLPLIPRLLEEVTAHLAGASERGRVITPPVRR
jgi:pimeloyl-ACP methyl ester carboxylesterase